MITVYEIKTYNPDTNSWIKSINNYDLDANSYKTLNEIFMKATDKESFEIILLRMYYSEYNNTPGIKIICDKSKPEHMFLSADKNPTFFNILTTIMPHFCFAKEKSGLYIYAIRTYNKDTYSYDFDFSEMIR